MTVNDGICIESLYHGKCCFDGGDCENEQGKCPFNDKYIGDGLCDTKFVLDRRFFCELIFESFGYNSIRKEPKTKI